MSVIRKLEKKIAALKTARDRCSKAFNATNNQVKRESLQLTVETLCYHIAQKEIELQNLLTIPDGQRNDDRPNFKKCTL